MALIKNYYNQQLQVTLQDCYWKIELENGIVGGKTKLRIRFNCYRSKIVADTNENKLMDFDFEFVPNLTSGVNFIEQAYLHAKTLSYFKDAVDA